MSSKEHLDFILNIPQYEQRTPEWFEQRRHRLTSSDAATALGINPYKKPVELLFEKCGCGRPFTGNEATLHGQKYEDECINKYCHVLGKTNVNVGMISFGDLDPIRKNKKYNNKRYHFLGGSADGIAIDVHDIELMVMLEAKCPMRRKIKHGHVPEHYYPQVQLNMFILDLEIADFIEYIPNNYGKMENFPILESFWNEVVEWRKKDITTHPEYQKIILDKIDNTVPTYLFIN
jgi:putative phage-type endonuclease